MTAIMNFGKSSIKWKCMILNSEWAINLNVAPLNRSLNVQF